MICNLLYRDPELVVALGKSIIFVNPNDLQIFKEITLPENLSSYNLKVKDSVDSNGDDEDDFINETTNLSSRKETVGVQNIALSHQRLLLAVTTNGQKALMLYSLRPEQGKLSFVAGLKKNSTALDFSRDDKLLLIADKAGDCYLCNCENIQSTMVIKHLLGHMNIVYDVLWSPDCKFIVTCDRDDKIRVTHYPEAYDIQSYCLGHKEFVSSICWLNDKILLSVSGDQTMRLWNYVDGKEIAIFELPGAGLKVCTRQIKKDHYQVAVLIWSIDDNTHILMQELTKQQVNNGGDCIWRCSKPHVKEPEMFCSNLCFVGDCVYAVGVKNGNLAITIVKNVAEAIPENQLHSCSMVNDYFNGYQCETPDITSFFKKRYDNLKDYLERKRKRQERDQKN